MKSIRRMGALLWCAVLLLGGLTLPAAADAPSQTLTILFTHDTHDHFLPKPAEGGGGSRPLTPRPRPGRVKS